MVGCRGAWHSAASGPAAGPAAFRTNLGKWDGRDDDWDEAGEVDEPRRPRAHVGLKQLGDGRHGPDPRVEVRLLGRQHEVRVEDIGEVALQDEATAELD